MAAIYFFPKMTDFSNRSPGFFLLRACWKIAGSKSLQKLNVDVEKRFRVWGSQKTSFRGKYGEYRQKTVPYPPPLGLLILCYQNKFAIMEILKIEILKQSFKLHKKSSESIFTYSVTVYKIMHKISNATIWVKYCGVIIFFYFCLYLFWCFFEE